MEKLIIDPGFKVMIMVLVVKDPFQVDFLNYSLHNINSF